MATGPRLRSLSRRVTLFAVAAFLPLRAAAVPGDILFSDNFERAALGPWTTTDATVSGILTGPQVSNSPTRGAFTRSQAVTITSPAFGAAVPAAQLSIWIRRGDDAFSEDPDAGEDLVLEYLQSGGGWGQLATYAGSGTPGQIIIDTPTLPADALHGGLSLRLRQVGGSGSNFDWWHIDDVVVTEIAPPPPLTVDSCDDFSGGLGSNWTVNPTTGFAGTSAATFQSPFRSMYTNGGVVEVTSLVIDTTDPGFSDLTMWIQRGSDTFSEDPDGGENLVVEYLDDVGAWIALETFSGAGAAGQVFLRTYNLPPAGRHAGFRLRFRQTGGSGQPWDFWHVDDVCLVRIPVPDLLVSKITQTLSDPFNGGSNPKAIPGATVLYTLGVTNEGDGPVDADTLVITDGIPADGALFVDTGAGDPIVFIDGPIASGLTYAYAADVSFSNQVGGGPPFTYIPVPDAQGFDPAVTGCRINPGGAMNAAAGGNTPSFNIQMRIRVD